MEENRDRGRKADTQQTGGQARINFEKAGLLLQHIEALDSKCGLEKSFKMQEKKLLGNRFLIGISKSDIKEERLLDICERMDMPENYLEVFKENFIDANLVFFGFEENERGCVYKVYLEFWDKITKEIHDKSNKFEPVLLHSGFKWDTLDNTKGAVARYICYPLLSVKDILKRLLNIYDGYKDRTPFEVVSGIINLASSRIANGSFIYLEVSEENKPRISFDINLYKANLRLKELCPFLSKMRQYYSIPLGEFDHLYDQIGANIFGHLSGGIDREGKDFLTTYYEVE